mgnify:CR=1 FL=1
MRIRVIFLHRAAEIVPKGMRVIDVELREGATLADLLEFIKNNVSGKLALGILKRRLTVSIVVNDVPIVNLNYRLRNGDTVRFLTPTSGG